MVDPALSFSFLAFFALSFFLVSPLAPLLDSVPEAPELADDFPELTPVPLVPDAPLLMPPRSAAPELVPELPPPDLPDAPDEPLLPLLPDELEPMPELAPPDMPDVPDAPLPPLLSEELEPEPVPPVPDEVSLEPEPVPPACAVCNVMSPVRVEVSAPALRPAPCDSATEDTEATKTNDNDWREVFNVMDGSLS